MDLFISSATVQDSTISNSYIERSSCRVTSSNLTMENVKIYDIYNSSHSELISQTLDSITKIINCSSFQSSSRLIVSTDSNVFIDGLELTHIESNFDIISISGSTTVEILNLEAEEIVIYQGSIISISKSSEIILTNINASQINATTIQLYDSRVSMIRNVSVRKSTK